jgi:hypothetical protein
MPTPNMFFGEQNIRDAVPGYQLAALSGLIAGGTAAAANVFAMRNVAQAETPGNLTRAVGISKIKCAALGGVTAYAAAASVAVAFYRATGYTALETNGTAVTAQRRKSTFLDIPSTELAAQVATTGALTAGTRTLAAQPFFVASFGGAVTFGGESEWTPEDHIPIALAGNEGIVAQLVAATPATGTIHLFFGVDFFRF